MMMYQILCGHINYALGKTRMQVKKDTLFWIHVYINLLKILKSYCQYICSILSIFHIITIHLLLIIITTNIVIRLITKTCGVIIAV
jgi:hypothetical protein